VAPVSVTSRLAGMVPEKARVSAIRLAYLSAEPELRRLDDISGRGGVMVDVGAWYGPWSARLAARAERVIAFEPTPLHEVLRRRLPSNVEVIAAAASDQAGESEIWLPGSGTGAEGLSSLHKGDEHSVSLKIPTVRIDELGLTGVTFMKIDVEGHEVPVLHGAEDTIRRDTPRLLIEVEARFQPAERITGLVEGWGYQGWVLYRGSWRPLDGYDLEARQAQTEPTARRGLVSTALWPYPRHVNSVLFLPGGEKPGSAGRPAQAAATR
jgi:FkbM family methyltransferase